jgi:hypothetical protein
MTTEQVLDIEITERAQKLWEEAGRQGSMYRKGTAEETRFYEYRAQEQIEKEKNIAYLST